MEGQLAGAEETGTTETPNPAPKLVARSLTRLELRRLWAHVGQIDNFWRSLGEIEPGAVARLSALANRHQWEVFLTQRPPSAGETAQLQSQRWLQAHGFEFPSVFVMNGSRGRVATPVARCRARRSARELSRRGNGFESHAVPDLAFEEGRGSTGRRLDQIFRLFTRLAKRSIVSNG